MNAEAIPLFLCGTAVLYTIGFAVEIIRDSRKKWRQLEEDHWQKLNHTTPEDPYGELAKALHSHELQISDVIAQCDTFLQQRKDPVVLVGYQTVTVNGLEWPVESVATAVLQYTRYCQCGSCPSCHVGKQFLETAERRKSVKRRF